MNRTTTVLTEHVEVNDPREANAALDAYRALGADASLELNLDVWPTGTVSIHWDEAALAEFMAEPPDAKATAWW